MIAGCPKCAARYRVEREKLGANGVRLRCAKCETVFRVRAPADAAAPERTQLQPNPPPAPAPKPAAAATKPAAPPSVAANAPAPAAVSAAPTAPAPRGDSAPAPVSGELVLVAIPEAEIAKQLADALAARGVRAILAHDGVEALLELQRQLPKAAVIAAHLPKMFGFQICELVKRNESLRRTWIVLAGAIHSQDRYRRPTREMYGADAYLELPDLPDGALPLLQQGGVSFEELRSAPQRAPAMPARPLEPARRPEPAAAAAAPAAKPVAAAAPAPRAAVGDGLDDQRAKAERLARIIVSDIVLYNEQKFAAAIQRGNVVEALDADLAEGRHLFQERVDARVRAERDHLAEELLRVAKSRGKK
jgi:predicted Zn finger-like uncharacterized protein